MSDDTKLADAAWSSLLIHQRLRDAAVAAFYPGRAVSREEFERQAGIAYELTRLDMAELLKQAARPPQGRADE